MALYHEEEGYINALRDIMVSGYDRPDRTGTGVLSTCGVSLKFNLHGGKFPLLTTKKMFMRGIVEELRWFLRGSTDAKELSKNRVYIWDGNSSREFLDRHGLDYAEGECGPIYGYQWRYSGAKYPDRSSGVDQIKQLIDGVRVNPYSRRHVVSAWTPSDINQMALPPCHLMFQMYVDDKNGLHCIMTQRSADMFLGIPFNIASYALLTNLVARECGLNAESLQINIGDAHIYKNHLDQVKTQIDRKPKTFPTIEVSGNIYEIDSEFDYVLSKYTSFGKLKGKMAI